jgi:O-antigen/teichoic acid export membrane protein
MVGYGMKVYGGSLVNYTYLRLDTFLLNAFAGTAPVGQYSMAVNLNEKLWLIDSSVAQATLPEVISKERVEAADLVALTSRTLLFVGGVMALLLAIVTPVLIPLMYGDAFRPAIVPLWLLLPGTVLYTGGRVLSQYFSGQLGRPGITSAIAAGGAVLSVVMYLLLIPRFRAEGAAFASSVVYAGVFLTLLWLFVKKTGIPVRRVVLPLRTDTEIYVRMFTRTWNAIVSRIRRYRGIAATV